MVRLCCLFHFFVGKRCPYSFHICCRLFLFVSAVCLCGKSFSFSCVSSLSKNGPHSFPHVLQFVPALLFICFVKASCTHMFQHTLQLCPCVFSSASRLAVHIVFHTCGICYVSYVEKPARFCFPHMSQRLLCVFMFWCWEWWRRVLPWISFSFVSTYLLFFLFY